MNQLNIDLLRMQNCKKNNWLWTQSEILISTQKAAKNNVQHWRPIFLISSSFSLQMCLFQAEQIFETM